MEHDKLRQGETKTTEQLRKELVSLRRRIAELEQTQSEHKKAGDKGRSLEIQLKDILDNAPVGVYRTTPDGRILMANPALVQMLGYSSFEELAQRNLEKDGFEPQYPRSMFKERIEKDGCVVGLESAWIRRDGTSAFIIETAWAVRDKHGRTLYYEGIVQDITNRKRMEEKLRESEERFRGIFDNAADGMVLADIESKKFIIANKMFSQMLGCNPEEIKNLSVVDIHPKNAVPYVIEQFERQSRKEISLARDIPVKRKDGSVFYTDINAFPITLAGKEYIVAIFRDVTERKRAEDETKSLKRQLEFILGATKTGLDIIDSQFNIRFIDPEWQKIYGNPTGKKCYKYFMGREKVCPDCGIVKALQAKSVIVSEEVLVKENNRPIQVTTIPFKNEKGEWLVAEVNVDITERKKAEEACRLSEEKFAKAFNSSPAAIFITTLKEGRFIDLNESAMRVFGYTREEVVGHTAKELNMWANYNDRDIVVQSIRRGNAVRDMEAHFRRKSGEVFDGIISVDIINIGGTECLISTTVDITERKKAEDALQKSEESGRAILDATTESVLLIDKQGTILAINKTAAQRLGRSIEELVGLNVLNAASSLISPALLKSRREQVNKVVRSGKSVRFEDRRKDKILDSNIYPIFDEKGQVTRLAIFACDITEQRKAEEMLRELKYRYQTLFESVPVGIGVSTPEGQVLECNDAALKVMGYSEDEIKQINLRDIYPDPQQRQELLKRFERDGFVRGFEVQLKRKDGTLYYASLTMTPFTFSGQNVRLTVQEDITERKRIEDSLERSENKYRTLLENLPQRIFLKDRDSVYTSCNENYAKDLRIKPEEIAGKTDYDFYPKELAEKYRSDDKKIIESGQIKDIEEKYLQDGRERTVHTVKTPVTDEQGEVIGVLGIFWDISEQKKAEEELGTYREKMTQAEQLVSVGAISASLSHELTQPLTVARLSIESVLAKPETRHIPGAVEKKIRNCLSGVSDACSIIARFRDYARGMSRTVVTEMSFKVIAERIVKLLEGNSTRAKVNVLVKGLDRLPPVYLSERDIEFLFFALIDNAIQAADGEKEHHLTISGAKKGRQIELRFADDCGGIAPENLDKIFELFFTTKPIGKGTGLGLCIVKQIASRVGGEVRVESEMGKGSTFFVTLPIKIGGKL